MSNLIAITGSDGAGKDTLGVLFYCMYATGGSKEVSIETTIEKNKDPLLTLAMSPEWTHPDAHFFKFAEEPNNSFESITGIDFLSLPRGQKENYRPLFAKYCNWWRDNYYEQVWSDKLFATIQETVSSLHTQYSFITDLRFKSEYDEVIRRGGKVIRIRKHNEPDNYLKDIATEYTIYNNGTLEEFLEKGVKLWQDIQSK